LAASSKAITPSKRTFQSVHESKKRPLTERQSEPRSETLHRMYNSMVQIDKPLLEVDTPKENTLMFKDCLSKAIEHLNDLDGLGMGELVEIQADLVTILSIITSKLRK